MKNKLPSSLLSLKSSDMNSNDFLKLNGLLAKLSAATDKATKVDGSFSKYHNQSMERIKDLSLHLQRLEQGLRTAKIVKQ